MPRLSECSTILVLCGTCAWYWRRLPVLNGEEFSNVSTLHFHNAAQQIVDTSTFGEALALCTSEFIRNVYFNTGDQLIWKFVILYLFLENIADSNLAFGTADLVTSINS